MPCVMLDVMNFLVFVVCCIVMLGGQSMTGCDFMCSQLLRLYVMFVILVNMQDDNY